MYWYSSELQPNPLAEVLAVHPSANNVPLIAEQVVGTGRSLFFGFDETWRWRYREDESEYAAFWMRTIRYLASVK